MSSFLYCGFRFYDVELNDVLFQIADNGAPFFWNWGENYAGSSGLPTKTFKTPQHQLDAKVMCWTMYETKLLHSIHLSSKFALHYCVSQFHPIDTPST